jgi:coatomer protein complex subunit epsilon
MADRADLLFTVRNAFYLGAYQQCLAEASDLEGLSDAEKIERDCFVYRAYIEIGSSELVLNEVNSSSPMALQAVRLLAEYQGKKRSKDSVLATISDWLQEPAYKNNAGVMLVVGLIYAAEENYVEALRACHGGLSLELRALSVQLCLKIDRVQQAEEQVKAMAGIDEDSTLTQLSTAWVNLYLGGAKVQEAFFIFQELGDKYNWTVRLYNGSAACNMRMGRFEEAEQQLMEALEKDPKNPDTLANLVTACLHLGKPTARYSNQLQTVAPQHILASRTAQAEEAFANAASAFAVPA